VASVPTAPIAVPATPGPPVAQKPAARASLRIELRDRAHRAKGTLSASVVAVASGREVRTAAVKVAVTAGTWRLRLCAGPQRGALHCALTKRMRTRTRSVRMPGARVAVASTSGAVRITAAIVDSHRRVRAEGSAASS
jgi:hypothetical protein